MAIFWQARCADAVVLRVQFIHWSALGSRRPIVGYEGGTGSVVALDKKLRSAGINPAACVMSICAQSSYNARPHTLEIYD
jgi:hypothetical protein